MPHDLELGVGGHLQPGAGPEAFQEVQPHKDDPEEQAEGPGDLEPGHAQIDPGGGESAVIQAA
jgi:hypothetical protein